MINLSEFLEEIKNEKRCWEKIQEIRKKFDSSMINSIDVSSKEEALEKANETIQDTLNLVKKIGIDFKKMDPSHGPGHLIRDYINSSILFNNIKADPKDIFIGFVGGTLHDLGCAIIPRYEESTRVVRHAEAGTLLVNELLLENEKLNNSEKLAIVYSILAHTHYLKPCEIKCKDGETRKVEPYKDLFEDKPIYSVWFPRWIDRLDRSSIISIGRHYLSLGEEHEDFDGIGHSKVDFFDYMIPLLRPLEKQINENGKRNQKMMENVKMFIDTQTNQSSYGKYDYGFMIKMRDSNKGILYKTIYSLEEERTFSELEEKTIY